MKKSEEEIFWFAIRTIYLFSQKGKGINVFEERICSFCGASEKEAFEKAFKEGIEYAKDNDMVRHEWMVCYWQDGDELIDGYELWSELYESDDSLDEFVANRYEKYEYNSD